jgi:hypothetical protein
VVEVEGLLMLPQQIREMLGGGAAVGGHWRQQKGSWRRGLRGACSGGGSANHVAGSGSYQLVNEGTGQPSCSRL